MLGVALGLGERGLGFGDGTFGSLEAQLGPSLVDAGEGGLAAGDADSFVDAEFEDFPFDLGGHRDPADFLESADDRDAMLQGADLHLTHPNAGGRRTAAAGGRAGGSLGLIVRTTGRQRHAGAQECDGEVRYATRH